MSQSQLESFYAFKVGAMWRYFKSQHFSFWMVCCYLFVEFVRPQSLFPAINILPWAQVFLLGSLVGALMDPSVKWVSCAANKWIILFQLFIIISIFFAIYPDIAKKHFMDFFGWFIIYFLITNIVNTKERFYVFLMIYLVSAAKVAIGTSKSFAMRGFSFQGWGLMGPRGYFENSGELAILMLMLFPLAFLLYQSLKDKVGKIEKWILIVFSVCPLLTIIGASSRGAQIALVLELLIIFRHSLYKPKALIGLSIVLFALFTLLPQEQKDRFSNSGDDRTSQQRLLYWKRGVEMMREFPVTGVGFFNFSTYFEDHFPGDMLYETAQLPHNILVQVGTDAGIFAVFFLLMIVSYCFLTSYKIGADKNTEPILRNVAVGLGYGVLGFFVAGQFVTVTYYPFLWVHLAFIAALQNVIAKPSLTMEIKKI